jgi:hypothetical protein
LRGLRRVRGRIASGRTLNRWNRNPRGQPVAPRNRPSGEVGDPARPARALVLHHRGELGARRRVRVVDRQGAPEAQARVPRHAHPRFGEVKGLAVAEPAGAVRRVREPVPADPVPTLGPIDRGTGHRGDSQRDKIRDVPVVRPRAHRVHLVPVDPAGPAPTLGPNGQGSGLPGVGLPVPTPDA